MQSVLPLCKKPKGACSAANSFLWYEPKRTVVCNQFSQHAKTLKVSTALQSVFLSTNLNGRWYAISLPRRRNPKGECSAAISRPWYEPKRTAVCNQSSHYAKTLKVHAALQSVFLGANLNGRWYAIRLPSMLKP